MSTIIARDDFAVEYFCRGGLVPPIFLRLVRVAIKKGVDISG